MSNHFSNNNDILHVKCKHCITFKRLVICVISPLFVLIAYIFFRMNELFNAQCVISKPGNGRCQHSSQWSSDLEEPLCTVASRSRSGRLWQPTASSHLSTAESWAIKTLDASIPLRKVLQLSQIKALLLQQSIINSSKVVSVVLRLIRSHCSC